MPDSRRIIYESNLEKDKIYSMMKNVLNKLDYKIAYEYNPSYLLRIRTKSMHSISFTIIEMNNNNCIEVESSPYVPGLEDILNSIHSSLANYSEQDEIKSQASNNNNDDINENINGNINQNQFNSYHEEHFEETNNQNINNDNPQYEDVKTSQTINYKYKSEFNKLDEFGNKIDEAFDNFTNSFNNTNQYYRTPDKPKNNFSNPYYNSPNINNPMGQVLKKKMDTMAIVSLILSISSLFMCLLTSIPGMVIGLVSLNNIKNSEEPLDGKQFAMAGAIVGGIFTFISLVVIIVMIIAGI